MSRALKGPAWHGPALFEILQGVTAAQAYATPIPSAHSIRDIVAHVGAWLELVRRRIDGERVGRVTLEMDWPPAITRTPASWKATVDGVRDAARRLGATLGKMDDGRLEDQVEGTDGTWSAYATLHGTIEHVLYHAGQIALLKKAAG